VTYARTRRVAAVVAANAIEPGQTGLVDFAKRWELKTQLLPHRLSTAPRW
jgi:hypothetical protein